MNLELHGKRAIVSGSTAGIGFAIARALALEGAAVVVNGRDRARVDAAVLAVRKAAPDAEVRGIVADVGGPEGCARLVEACPEVDVLVNNAALFEPKAFGEITDGDWLRFFEVNVLSGVRLSRAYLPGMLAHDWGRIVFISSESALQIPVEMIHYGATMTAQLAVARGLAETTRGTAVTVNAVLPGPTRSEGVGTFMKALASQENSTLEVYEKEFFEHARPSSILQRFLDPQEVAALVVFVASGLASGVNGAALRVDGGVVRAIV
jgi:NAD(P)-dependent dehydrogenase (short-subunit alcohol dehydrogenase family)